MMTARGACGARNGKHVRRLASRLGCASAVALCVFHLPWLDKAQGIAGVVNTDVVTYSEIRDLADEKERAASLELKGEELVQKIEEIRLAAVNELIDRRLILQEFKKKGATIPEELVDQRIESIVRDKFGGDREAFLRDLERQGYTLKRFRELDRDKIIVIKMRRDAVAGKIHIDEEQIRDYYRHYDASGKSLEERHDDIEKTLIENESKRILEDWIQELRKGAYIKIYTPLHITILD